MPLMTNRIRRLWDMTLILSTVSRRRQRATQQAMSSQTPPLRVIRFRIACISSQDFRTRLQSERGLARFEIIWLQHSPSNTPIILALAGESATELDAGPHSRLPVNLAQVTKNTFEAE